MSGSIIVVRQLLAAGANGALRDKEGKTAAVHAKDQGNPELINLLRAAESR